MNRCFWNYLLSKYFFFHYLAYIPKDLHFVYFSLFKSYIWWWLCPLQSCWQSYYITYWLHCQSFYLYQNNPLKTVSFQRRVAASFSFYEVPTIRIRLNSEKCSVNSEKRILNQISDMCPVKSRWQRVSTFKHWGGGGTFKQNITLKKKRYVHSNFNM